MKRPHTTSTWTPAERLAWVLSQPTDPAAFMQATRDQNARR